MSVRQSLLSGAVPTWDINTGVYASKSLSVTAQETNPYGVSFSNDGTKVYIVGNTNSVIFQYTLSTPWDISTGSYASKSLSVVAQGVSQLGLALSSDGTKAYTICLSNNTIFQYTLSTPWDISTGSYASKNLSVAAQDTTRTGLVFSSDGTKAYFVGGGTNKIYQYTLSTPWDISTGSYASKNLSVNAQDTIPNGLSFNNNGTKAYISGDTNNTIFQYTLSTPWDISTGSYASKNLSVAAQSLSPMGIYFNPYGIKAYVMGGTNDSIYEYNLA